MRIQKLKIKGFGSFYEETTVDFAKLTKEHNIFLIHGKTGSGKTTIFSAILCALYGQGSNQRKPVDLVSKYMQEKESMVLDLYYQIEMTNYHIHREYSGKGLAKGKKHYLEQQKGDDWEVLAVGATEVTQFVTEQLGVTQKQFSQIAMLQQGTINHLLTATKKERKEFLKDLFQSFSLDELKESVKEDFKKIQQKGKKQEVQLQDRWQEIQKEFFLSEEKNWQHMSQSKLRDFIEEQHQKQSEEIQRLTEEKEKKQAQQKRIEEEIEEWKKYLELQEKKEQWVNEWQQLQNTKLEYENKKIVLKRIEEDYPLVEIYRQKEELESSFLKKEEDWKEKQKQLLSLEEILCQLQENYEQEAFKEKEVTLKKEQQNLEQQYQKLKEQLRFIEKKVAYEKEETLLEEKLKNKKEEWERLDHLISSLLDFSIWEEEYQKEKQAYLEQQQQWQEEQKEYRILKENYESYCLLAEKKNEKLLEIEKLEEKQKESTLLWQTKNEQYLRHYSVILAAHLKDGKPCPVCGSCEHPKKAKADENEGVTEEELQIYRQQAEKDQQQWWQAKEKFQQLVQEQEVISCQLEKRSPVQRFNVFLEEKKQRLLMQEKELRQEEQRLEEEKDIYLEQKELAKNYQIQKDILFSKIQEIEGSIHAKQELIQSIHLELSQEVLNKEITEIHLQEQKDEIAKIIQQQEVLQQRKQTQESELEEKRQKITLMEGQFQSLSIQVEELKQKKEKIDEQWEILWKKYQIKEGIHPFSKEIIEQLTREKQLESTYIIECTKYEQKKKQLEEERETLEKTTLPLPHHSLIEDREEKEKLQLQQQELSKIIGERMHRLLWSENKFQEIWQLKEQTKENDEIYQWLEPIYSLLTISKNGQQSFEDYVLYLYFEQVIYFANLRLQKLTHQRYELKVDKELSLWILDYENGKLRSPNTLSGGEKFKFTLSLALGLSDLITNRHSKIHISSLFIDEGFGSLDEDSLNEVLSLLNDLAVEGNERIIGIISHIDLLKEAIPNQLQVMNYSLLDTKKRKGSRIEQRR